MTAPGSRARSREIGYAEAMAEMSELIDAEKRRWARLADSQLDPTAHAIASALSVTLRKLGDFANGAAQAHGIEGSGDLMEFLTECLWHPNYGAQAAPHETGSFPAI